MIIFSDDFDLVVPYALPAHWNPTPSTLAGTASGWQTTTALDGIGPISSPNMCCFPAGTPSTFNFLTCDIPDTDNGQVTVSAYTNAYGAAQVGRTGVCARGSASTLTAGTSEYLAWINWNTDTIGLSRINGGTETQLATVLPSLTDGVWVNLSLQLSGTSPTTCTVVAQRVSDGYYCTVGGSWQASPTSCISSSDSSPITGAGYAALWCEEVSSAAFNAFYDNFLFSDARPTPPPNPPLIVRVPHAYYPSISE